MSAPMTNEPIDLDVQEMTTGDWDELVAEIIRNAGDTAPQDPDRFTISGCCGGCGTCSNCSGCGGC